MYDTLLVYYQSMKKYTLILAASLISSMAFAQILPDSVTGGTMSGEVPVLNSAPTMSGEAGTGTNNGDININLPFDPSEVENMPTYNSASDYEFPPYSLNSATTVQTGPESIILFMLALALGTGIYTYRMRTGRDQ
jgi:hypothetical protein